MSRDRIEQHPEEYRADLNPDYGAGQNDGPTLLSTRTAYDLKEVHQDLLRDLRDDELKQIPILDEGTRLEQGGVYFDLRHPEWGEVHARGDMTAGRNNCYVPKSVIDYQLWNLLTGVTDPISLGELTPVR
jgi:hypothetical protein